MFTCYYCEKVIQGVSVVVDEKHIMHSECAKEKSEVKTEDKKEDNIIEKV